MIYYRVVQSTLIGSRGLVVKHKKERILTMDTTLSKALREFTTGPLNQLIVNLGGQDGNQWEDEFKHFLRKEPCWSNKQKWEEKDGVIYFSVTSDGTTGPQWIKRLESKGFRLMSDYAKQVLCSPDLKPTTGIVSNIRVLKGELFKDSDRITKNIRNEANKRKLTTPNAEIACLIRENFSDNDIKAMGLVWIIIMHEPINDSDGDPRLLNANRHVAGRWLYASYDRPDDRWNREGGFAFVASQSSTSDPKS